MNQAFQGSLALVLADGSAWHIFPGHDEAVPVVQALGAIMQLKPGDQPGRPLVVVTRGHHPAVRLPPHSSPPLVCDVGPGVEISSDLFPIQVSRLALAIARAAQSRGALLLHGALAECPPSLAPLPFGVLLAGPGTVGKTTASQRLPPPWRSLSDDAALVVRDQQGQYWAHPWPTWSLFYGDGPGGSWDVQRALRLRAVFFLRQAPQDRAQPVTTAEALALLAESVPQVAGPMMHGLEQAEERAVREEWLAAANVLAPAIAVYTLDVSLSGAFWREIERALSDHPLTQPCPRSARQDASQPLAPSAQDAPRLTAHVSGITFHGSDQALSVVYTGPSMNPTLRQPDLLMVVPYGNRTVRPGDVIYFRSAEKDHAVVHRVVAVLPQGIRTRGDNNPSDDPGLLRPSEVIGQVVAAQRGQRQRRVAGGWRGQLDRYGVVLWRLSSRLRTMFLHGSYYALARSGVFRSLLPPRLRPRLFVFRSRRRRLFKLLMGRRQVGHYDASRGQWHINRPFRLFVGEANLPRPPKDSERADLRSCAMQGPNASSSTSARP